MNGLDFLNLVIGLIFIYLIYSIAASTIWEIIISLTNMRGRMLLKWMCDNFEELSTNTESKRIGEWQNEILDHPLAKGMLRKYEKLPSYISSEVFTDVLFDIIVNENSKDQVSELSLKDVELVKKKLKSSQKLKAPLKRVFIQYLNEASGDLLNFKKRVGKWFDETQQRLMGAYKKSLQLWIFIIATILVGLTNADTIQISSYLYRNPETRNALAAQFDSFRQDSAMIASISSNNIAKVDSITGMSQEELANHIESSYSRLKELDNEINKVGIPLGWEKEEIKALKGWNILKKIGGLLLTIFAVSLGAPFWFDVLNKLATLRSSGTKPKTLLEEDDGKGKKDKNQDA